MISERVQKQDTVAPRTAVTAMMALVFALGMQTMIVELALPRLLAPAFGNTLFCWTAAISEVLAALALGYHFGGILSSKKVASRDRLLWRLAAISSGWVILSAIGGDKIVHRLSGFGMITGPLVGTLLLAVPPAAFGAAVLPICVGVMSQSRESGRTAGRLYAFSTVGSVMGVLITGYLLLPVLGIAGALLTGAACVFVTFIPARHFVFGIIGFSVVIASATFVEGPRADNILMDKSNGYHRIRVVTSEKFPDLRLLYLDSSLEGAVKLSSTNPGLGYQRDGVRIVAQLPNIERCLFLGGGSFSMPRFLKAKYPDLTIDVAEIDPDVLDAAKTFLELSPGLNIFVGDARRVLASRPEKYDLIMNDAFHGLRKIPFHLVTRQFHQIVADKLTPKGIYAINVIGRAQQSRLLSSMIQTLEQDFKWVNIAEAVKEGPQNLWILASNHPIPVGGAASTDPGKGTILTDNHAPVEFLVVADLMEEKTIRRNKLRE